MIDMRIAMIGQKGMPASHGGVERHVHDLSVELAKAGHNVTVYSRFWYSQLSADVMIEGVLVKHLPTLKTKHLDTISHALFASFHALFQGYDVVHYHGVGPSLVSWIPRLFSKSKVVTTFHSIDRYHQKWGAFARWVLRLGEKAAVWFAHETITVSRSLEMYCLNEFDQETVQIPNGVKKSNPIQDSSVLKKFGLKSNQYILMVSRLVPHKGAHLLVEAFTALKNNNPDFTNLKLVIAGGSVYTNKYIESLHEQASQCNDIVFTDFQGGTALEALYQNSLVLVHPSLSEGLPITVLEAMSAKKPVLLSNIPEHLELVNNPECIFTQNNVAALTDTINKFLRLSPAGQNKLGEENITTIESGYRWEKLVPQIESVYLRKKSQSTSVVPASAV